MVVIPVGRVEQRPRHAGGDVKPELPGIEGFRVAQIADLQVDMPDRGPGRRAAPRPLDGGGKAGEIERQGIHPHLAAPPAPAGGGPVRIDLDAVAFRVRQVDGLADKMVGGTVELDVVVGGMA